MAYLTMMGARVGMVAGAGAVLANAATVAVRYSCVRQQGFAKNRAAGARGAAPLSFRSEELAVIEYGVQQRRLLQWRRGPEGGGVAAVVAVQLHLVQHGGLLVQRVGLRLRRRGLEQRRRPVLQERRRRR